MTSLQVQFEVLRHARRVTVLAGCAEHDFTDQHHDPRRRLRAGEVECRHCRVIVPVLSAFLYEQGRRHGERPDQVVEGRPAA